MKPSRKRIPTSAEFVASAAITGPTSAGASGPQEGHNRFGCSSAWRLMMNALELDSGSAVLAAARAPEPIEPPGAEPAHRLASASPPRPAWIEIDLRQLERNFQHINHDKPARLEILCVVKDEAYGHGALRVAQTALECGARFLGVATLEEAVTLRHKGIKAPILLLGDRHENELPWCLAHDLTCCVSEAQTVQKLGQLAARSGKRVPVHLK